MDRTSRWERYAPLSGALFFISLAVSVALTWNTPDNNDPASSVVNYWDSHSTKAQVSAALGGLAVLFFLWFAGVVRARIAAAEGPGSRLAATAFAGMIMFAVGGAIFSGLTLAAADVAGKSQVPDATVQTLSILNNEMFIPVAVGAFVAMLALALAVFRYGVFTRWMGWFAVVVVVISVTPIGFIGFMLFAVWSLIAAVMMFAEGAATARPAASPPPAA